MAQGSILSGVIQSPVDFVGALYRGQQMAQQRQAHEQNMLAGAQAMRMNDQSMQIREQNQQQQVTREQYEMAVQKMRVMGNIARRARELPESERPAFAQSLNQDMLRSVGIDPQQVAAFPKDDKSLDELIAQTSALVPEEDGGVQQAQYVPGLGYVQQRRDGSVGLQELGEEEQKRVQAALAAESDRKAQEAAGKRAAVLDVEGEKVPENERNKNWAATVGKLTATDIIENRKNLPRIEADVQKSEALIAELLSHPGRKFATGGAAYLPVVKGTPQADFVNRLEQMDGKSFLAAFETLKGGGQITEIEGAKATQAINRMKRATTEAEFNAAAADLLDTMKTSLRLAREASEGRQFEGLGTRSGQSEVTPQSRAPATTTPATSRYQIEVMD